MKDLAQRLVSGIHVGLFNRGWPDRLGLYFHNVESGQRETFREVIERIGQEGYRFVGVDEYAGDGPKSDERLAFVSFDDNYVDWVELIPILERLDVEATFYVNTGPMTDWASESEIATYYADRLRYKGAPTRPLSSADLREIQGAGHTIGAHTHNHFVLADLPLDAAKQEIDVCRERIEQTLGGPVRHFSYPFGMRRHFSPELKRYCLNAGFDTIARATPGLLHEPFDGVTIQRTDWRLSDSFESNRIRMSVDGRIFEKVTGRSAVA